MYSAQFIEASQLACKELTEAEKALIHEAWGERRPIPKDIADKLYDLMEEYGEDHDLGENWWLNEGDIEEVYITGTDNN